MRFPWSKESKLWSKVEEVSLSLSVLNNKLSARVDQMSRRSRELFEACVKAHQEGDTERAALYASELSQLRRSYNNILRCQLSLEAVIYRLATVKDLGDVRIALQPIRGIVSKIGGDLQGVLPEVSGRVLRVQELIDEVSLEIGSVDDRGYSKFEAADDEAKRILAEAAAVASRRASRT
ncbi:MAG: hypothetical protein RMJ28_00125 [Nitrososphaerota archaeon]|nr:hypothetical protein [Candidatus Calditenuaceae archaeon]MDW8072638.1 hypothetical protein [Nitrososphaerota archaeon]